jgi:hypothetical protein
MIGGIYLRIRIARAFLVRTSCIHRGMTFANRMIRLIVKETGSHISSSAAFIIPPKLISFSPVEPTNG